MKIFSTGEVCRELGIPLEKLYYWERVGKIPASRRLGNGKRYFVREDVARLKKLLVRAETRR